MKPRCWARCSQRWPGLLVELGLPNFKKLPYDASVVDGGVVVAVKSTEQNRPSIEDVVRAAGAVKVKWV